MGKILLGFIKGFVVKYFSTTVLENIVIILLEKLVKSTDSQIDDEIFEAVFKKVEKDVK